MQEKHFKPGVDLRFMSTQILYAWDCAAICCGRYGIKCLASSLYRKGDMASQGFHGTGNAIDISMTDVPGNLAFGIWDELNKWIGRAGGGQFDVVNELRPGSSPGWTGPHIHIEFDPKEK